MADDRPEQKLGKTEKPENLQILRESRSLSIVTGRGHGPVVILAVMAGLLGWLWPIGIGGKMPVGGDVTRFFIGLMGVLSRSLEQGRLPIWNDLWGYGFPGIGESQMGVYYPPHLLLYGVLPNRVGLCGEPGAAHALGRAGRLVGRGGSACHRSGQGWRRSPSRPPASS